MKNSRLDSIPGPTALNRSMDCIFQVYIQRQHTINQLKGIKVHVNATFLLGAYHFPSTAIRQMSDSICPAFLLLDRSRWQQDQPRTSEIGFTIPNRKGKPT